MEGLSARGKNLVLGHVQEAGGGEAAGGPPPLVDAC